MIELLRDIARRCEPGVSTVGKPETLRAVTQAADEIESLRKQLAAANRTLDETAPWRELQAENKRLREQLAAVTKERDELADALEGLYLHTKNNMAICGLNEKAKSALAKVSADKTGVGGS